MKTKMHTLGHLRMPILFFLLLLFFSHSKAGDESPVQVTLAIPNLEIAEFSNYVEMHFLPVKGHKVEKSYSTPEFNEDC